MLYMDKINVDDPWNGQTSSLVADNSWAKMFAVLVASAAGYYHRS
jgi:hypothetical protein